MWYCDKFAKLFSFSKKSNIKFLSSANSISDRASFPGYKGEFSTSLEFIYPENTPQIQCYRVMNRKGLILDESQDPRVIIVINWELIDM